MEVILRFSPCLYEPQRLLISVYDSLFPQNVMFQLTIGMYNGIQFLVIGGVFLDSIRECLTMVCHQILVLSENCTHTIVICININLQSLMQIRKGEYQS
jgi:hypothetical protein